MPHTTATSCTVISSGDGVWLRMYFFSDCRKELDYKGAHLPPDLLFRSHANSTEESANATTPGKLSLIIVKVSTSSY
jgi:hypothetical protein